MSVVERQDLSPVQAPVQWFRMVALLLMFMLIYILTGKLGLLLAIPPGVASPMWPPSGLSLAAVLLMGMWVWPGVWLGSFILNFYTISATGPGSPWIAPAVAAAIATGSTLQAVIGASILRRVIGDRHPLDRARDALMFAGLTAALGCMTSATIGVAAVCLAGLAPWSAFGINWTTWWLGDAGGVLILTPLILSWSRRAPRDRQLRWLELVLCFALTLSIGAFAFASPTSGGAGLVMALLLIPFLVWAASRFGAQESLTLLLVIAGLAVWGTIRHRGPFAFQSPEESQLLLEMFLSVAALTALYVGAAITERRATERGLRQVNVELEERISERTAELQATNHALSAEVAERRHAEARLRLVVDRVPAVLWSVDRELRFTSLVGNGLQTLGAAPERIVGRTVAQVFRTPQASALPMESHRRALLGESVVLEQLWNARTYHIQIEPLLDEWGVGVGCIGIAFDITERTRAEEQRLGIERQMLEAQKLESLGVMSGGIAHDFNNLLTAILGNASMLKDALPRAAASGEFVDSIVTAAHRAAELCRQMLAYSGRGRFVVESVSLNRLVRETAELLSTTISKKANLKLECQERLPAVEADVTQIRQVLMNLVINASEAIGEQSGTIFVTTGVQHLDAAALEKLLHGPTAAPGEYAYLEVRDTGCGMNAEVRARLFDPFFTTKFTGRGLGLSAVQGIVRGHQGALQVSSALGQGSTFRLLLPALGQLAEAAEIPTPVREEWRGSGCALIVEDEPLVRGYARDLLAGLGFEVLTAADGREGVELFRANAARLKFVLLDLTMPQLGGGEAFTEMQRIRPSVPILMMSGYDEHEALESFDSRGVAGILHKPFVPEELRDKLRMILG